MRIHSVCAASLAFAMLGMIGACADSPTQTASIHPVQSASLARSGGNNDNAKLCQKGGYLTLYTSTAAPFATVGDCVSYAARGGIFFPAASLVGVGQFLDPTAHVDFTGTGLAPSTLVTIYATSAGSVEQVGSGFTNAQGTFSYPLLFSCPTSYSSVYAVGTTPGGVAISSNVVEPSCS